MTALWAKGVWNDARKAELARLWMQPINQIAIAERLGSDSSTVARYAACLGLPKRFLAAGPETWIEAQVKLLRRLWDEDKSCAVIAQEIGGSITKNAVIGKARRLKLPARQMARYGAGKGKGPRPLYRPKVSLPRKVTFGPPRPPQPFKPREVSLTEPISSGMTLMQLTERTCKYPVGEATGGSQLFCGASKEVESSYCAFHHRLCWVAVSRSDDRRRAKHVEYLARRAA